MSTMRAIEVQKKSDQPHPTLVLGTAPKPELKPNNLLVKVRATAVNRADLVQSEGKYPPPPGESTILGLEMSGEVEEVGENCNGFKKGDRVCALLAGGGYAEYVSVPQQLAIRIPEGMTYEVAASIPEAFITSYQCLYKIAQLQPGETILIHAGASGVGIASIQLAKLKGCKVIVTVGSDEKGQLCKQYGADFAINYKSASIPDLVKKYTDNKGVSVLLDPVGSNYWEKNLQCMALDGRWIVIGFLSGPKAPSFNMTPILTNRISIIGSTLRSRSLEYKADLTRHVSELFPLFMEKKLLSVIDKTFSWNQFNDAHQYVRENQNVGKVVVTVDCK